MADTKISALPASTTPLAGTEVLPIVQSGVTRQVSVANLTAGRSVSASQLNVEAGASVALVAIFNSYSVNGAYLQGRSSGTIVWDIGTTKNFFPGGITTDMAINTRAGAIVLGTNSTPRLTLNTSGDATIANGNLVIGTSGKGIDFSADPSAAGMTSELLDDYEEGTWTATLLDGVNTITTLTGLYTKVGRVVTVMLGVAAVYDGAGLSGAFTVSGLPFAVGANSVGTTLIGSRQPTIAIRAVAYPTSTIIYFYTTSSETFATTDQILLGSGSTQRLFFQLTYSV
jgi:hypothetical protein